MVMCDECGVRPGVVHLTTIMDGARREINLCAECFQKKKEMAFDYRALIQQIGQLIREKNNAEDGADAAEEEPVPDITCEACGMTYEEYTKTHRLGCAQCYSAFRRPLEEWMQASFGKSRHEGRASGGNSGAVTARMRLERLRRLQKLAIDNEEYEQAALLRDQIRALAAETEAANA